MAEVINLRRARKAQSRKAKSAQAEENRIKYGRSKSDQAEQAKHKACLVKHLDGHRLETSDQTKPAGQSED